jgi:hypothetical protein
VFELVLKTLGPQLPMDEGNSLRQWHFSSRGERLIFHFRQKCHDASRGRGPCLTAGLNKPPYWLAQLALYMAILELIFPIALQPQGLACKLPTLQASLRLVHLKLAAEFVRLRYAHGLAVLDREMQRATWTSDERHDSQAEDRVRKQQSELCLKQNALASLYTQMTWQG